MWPNVLACVCLRRSGGRKRNKRQMDPARTENDWEKGKEERGKAVSTLKWIRGTQRWNNGRWKIKLGLPKHQTRRPGIAKLPLLLICWLKVNDARCYSPLKTSCSASPHLAVLCLTPFHISNFFFFFFRPQCEGAEKLLLGNGEC